MVGSKPEQHLAVHLGTLLRSAYLCRHSIVPTARTSWGAPCLLIQRVLAGRLVNRSLPGWRKGLHRPSTPYPSNPILDVDACTDASWLDLIVNVRRQHTVLAPGTVITPNQQSHLFNLGPLFLSNPFAERSPLLICINRIRSHDDECVGARIVNGPVPVFTQSRIERRNRSTDGEEAQGESDHTDHKANNREGVHSQ